MEKTKTTAIPETDIVLWGATSFVGQLLAGYLWPRYGATGELRLALGGRNTSKLEKVKKEIAADDRLPIIQGDAGDEAFLDDMTKKTRVVISTVGPYALYGSPLVAACAANSADYCDLTGEAQWIVRMMDAHEKAAQASGARIVHTCGFDSIPSDLGVLFIQNEARKRFGHPLSQVKLRLKAARGGASGGTVASVLNVIVEARKDFGIIRMMRDPYALVPKGMRPNVPQPEVLFPQYDADTGAWVGPFIMHALNSKVVHRSNALLDFEWGRDFAYDEAMITGKGVRGALGGAAVSGGAGLFVLSAFFGPTRYLLRKTILPSPGEGPSPRKQKEGFFKLLLVGKDKEGNRLRAHVSGDRDPGYGATCGMLGEAGVCLAKDISRSNVKGGFWTPASAMGVKLIDRLRKNAGLTFEIVE